MNLIKNVKLVRHSNAVAAGATVITPSAGIDCANFERCTFVAAFGAIVAGAATSVEVHESDDDSSYAALAGSKVTVADSDDNKLVYVEIVKPLKRYLKMVVNRATQNATLDGIVAILSGPGKAPTIQDSTVLGGEVHVSPIAGTA